MDRSNAGFVEAWRKAAPAMAEIGRQELRSLDTAAAIAILDDAYIAAVRDRPAPRDCGLVEQQRVFMKGLRR